MCNDQFEFQTLLTGEAEARSRLALNTDRVSALSDDSSIHHDTSPLASFMKFVHFKVRQSEFALLKEAQESFHLLIERYEVALLQEFGPKRKSRFALSVHETPVKMSRLLFLSLAVLPQWSALQGEQRDEIDLSLFKHFIYH